MRIAVGARLAHVSILDAGLALALAGGLALRYAFGLQPVWWLAWLAPLPLLVAALRSTRPVALILTLLAALIGASGSFHYLSTVMSLPAAT
jgi:apolipoprotein N-acyltransferase